MTTSLHARDRDEVWCDHKTGKPHGLFRATVINHQFDVESCLGLNHGQHQMTKFGHDITPQNQTIIFDNVNWTHQVVGSFADHDVVVDALRAVQSALTPETNLA